MSETETEAAEMTEAETQAEDAARVAAALPFFIEQLGHPQEGTPPDDDHYCWWSEGRENPDQGYSVTLADGQIVVMIRDDEAPDGALCAVVGWAMLHKLGVMLGGVEPEVMLAPR